MKRLARFRTFEEDLVMLQKKAKSHVVTVKDLFFILFGKGRPIFLILLSLPFCQPFMIPGLSTLFGIFIAFIGLRMSFGKKVLLPHQYLTKKLSAKYLLKLTANTLKFLRKSKKWTYPRYMFLTKSKLMKLLNGIIIFALGLLLALPLPIPLSNFLVAWSIVLIAFGILENDGLFVIGGYFVTAIMLAVYLQLAHRVVDAL